MEHHNNMDSNFDPIELIRQVQLGDHDSGNKLAKLAEGRIFAYIYRLTLDHNLSQDLLQETMLEMVESFSKKRLKFEHAGMFWSWLYRTALGKVQHYFRDHKNNKMVQMSILKEDLLSRYGCADYNDGLSNAIRKELSVAVFEAMAKLKLSHRNVLVLRYFEQMSFAEIAAISQCSELRVRLLFFRAKHALKRQLSRHGFGKELLLPALTLFALSTSSKDALAASASVAAASSKVGPAATVIGSVTSREGIAATTIITTLVFAFLAITALTNNDTPGNISYSTNLPDRSEVKSTHNIYLQPSAPWPPGHTAAFYEKWNYFPGGIDGPAFRRRQAEEIGTHRKCCSWLTNRHGNYHYNCDDKKVYINNHNQLSWYLMTLRLPSDPSRFIDFLNQTESQPPIIEEGLPFSVFEGEAPGFIHTRDERTGLLVSTVENRYEKLKNYRDTFTYNTLDESDFQDSWPPDIPMVDLRDQMHKRGWTYFRIDGQINGQEVQGTGQIPFIYDKLAEHPPWLILNIANQLQIIDCPTGAYLVGPDGTMIANYPPGSFFKGLLRPWMGIHTADIVRRDAVQQRVPFKTEAIEARMANPRTGVIVTLLTNNSAISNITYIIDREKDLIESISFMSKTYSGYREEGILTFEYLEDISNAETEFTEPSTPQGNLPPPDQSLGINWLIQLAQGNLGSAKEVAHKMDPANYLTDTQ